MKYFNTLPTILSKDDKGNYIALKNIITRATLLPSLSNNPLLFYTYAAQEGDTPETVAFKYYGDQYRYWIVLHGNGSLDPQFDWPMSYNQFNAYIVEKYTNDTANLLSIPANTVTFGEVIAYTQSTNHHYEKVITTIDNTSKTQTVKIVELDANTALATLASTHTVTFPNGQSSTQTIEVNSVSVYDYEVKTNEDKRNIKLINSRYVGAMEQQLKKLMGR